MKWLDTYVVEKDGKIVTVADGLAYIFPSESAAKEFANIDGEVVRRAVLVISENDECFNGAFGDRHGAGCEKTG